MTDLKEYKYKYDLHVHSLPTSGCADFSPEEVVRTYAEAGFNGIVLTNHMYGGPHEYETKEKFTDGAYIPAYRRAKAEGEKLGLDVILGIEIRFPESVNDFLVFGIDEDDVPKAYDYTFSPYEDFYKGFKNEHNLIIQAHPMRLPCEPVPQEIVDGYEVFNMHPGHNPRAGLAAQLTYGRDDLYVIGGTDFHHANHQGMCALLCKERIKDSFQLAEVIKSKDYILEIWGNKIIPYQY